MNQINIDHYLDLVEKEAKKRGRPVEKAHMQEMRKRLHKQEKRANHRASYMASCMEYQLPFNSDEEAFLYENEQFLEMESLGSRGKKNENDKEVVLPIRVTLGVTMSLAGFFLWMVPIPVCKVAGQVVMDIGIGFLIDAGVTEYEKRS